MLPTGPFVHAFKNDLIKNEYGIKFKCETTENPQANPLLERIHQAIENLVHTFDLQNIYLDEDYPWSDILAATGFEVRSIYPTKLQVTPSQLVFSCNMILNTPSIVD